MKFESEVKVVGSVPHEMLQMLEKQSSAAPEGWHTMSEIVKATKSPRSTIERRVRELVERGEWEVGRYRRRKDGRLVNHYRRRGGS